MGVSRIVFFIECRHKHFCVLCCTCRCAHLQ